MKNAIICPNCNTENPFYNGICVKCSAYLRERVVNIDLWNILWKIIETPGKAFQKIIYAEHKNFIVFLTLLLAVKYFIFALMMAIPVFSKTEPYAEFYTRSFYFIILFFSSILALSFIYKSILNGISIKTRFKDILSVLIYSNSPLIFALVIFFPVEMILFGDYLFTYNPSPVMLKPAAAYILASVEFVMIVWSIILTIVALYTISKSLVWSILFVLTYYLAITGMILLSMKILF